MREEVLVILPLPSPKLHPNNPPASRGGRIKKASIAKSYRRKAREAVEDLGLEGGPWERVEVFVTFFHRNKRNRDDVNFLAALKPAYDGIVDAGLVEDDSSDHWVTRGARFEIDRDTPRVEILLRRA